MSLIAASYIKKIGFSFVVLTSLLLNFDDFSLLAKNLILSYGYLYCIDFNRYFDNKFENKWQLAVATSTNSLKTPTWKRFV